MAKCPSCERPISEHRGGLSCVPGSKLDRLYVETKKLSPAEARSIQRRAKGAAK